MPAPLDGSLLRLLDASANRAREALRVLEDYARFVLDDAGLTGELKSLRHELRALLERYLDDAILHRDTPGDVGVSIKTEAELRRPELADVIVASGKRLGEALRSIEEYLKIAAPRDAAVAEAMRYRFYDVELHLARTLRPGNRFVGVRLCVLITEALCARPWPETAELAIAGGADCLQLREKNLDAAELLSRAVALAALCRRHNVICIINDRADVALACGADGVHLGQTDLPAIEARKILGARRIVGVSTHHVEQAKAAVRDGADYIGVGPIFPSRTKPQENLAGLEYLRQAARTIRIPLVAISGISADNVDHVVAAGASAVAVSAAVIGALDVATAASRIKAKLPSAGDLSSATSAGAE